MILGMGNDMVDIRRIEAALTRHGERFARRLFTPAEIALAEARGARRIATYAGRFAAKEAAAKALGTGFRGGLMFTHIEVVRAGQGKPMLVFHDVARTRLEALTPPGMRPTLHLSLTDEAPYAWAVVLIEARP